MSPVCLRQLAAASDKRDTVLDQNRGHIALSSLLTRRRSRRAGLTTFRLVSRPLRLRAPCTTPSGDRHHRLGIVH